jgi:hypothetical protein
MKRENTLALIASVLLVSVLFVSQTSRAEHTSSTTAKTLKELARQRAKDYAAKHSPFIASSTQAKSKKREINIAATSGSDAIASDNMTSMGRLAHLTSNNLLPKGKGGRILPDRSGDTCVGADEDCSNEGFSDGPAGGQAEVSIAVDPTGLHVVIGFNDTRGFALSPLRLSGFAYSDDGGVTFTDGGQLPSASAGTIPTGAAVPQVFGDPDVKFVPGGAGGQFIYASIMVKGLGAGPSFTGSAQTMCVHRSTDFGHTWTGPFEVTAATNPTGVLTGVNARDAADKEFFDVDPDTGRVLMSWSNFTAASVIPGQVEIRTTFSDNIMSGAPPTWSAGVVLNAGSGDFDTASVPRFLGGGSNNVYVAWSRTSNTTTTPYDGQGFNNVGFSKSTDNGATWSASALNLRSSYFFPPDYILGNDRTHAMPGMAVDNSGGANNGNIYVVYGDNTTLDGEDIAFQRSIDGGATFSPSPIMLDARPGLDRPQWFPYVSVDQTSGRVWVTYFDQGVGNSGDWMQTTGLYSDDGGVTWTRPFMISDRPFHGGYGNDTGQPNLGDYIGSTIVGGNLFATWGGNPPIVLFTEGLATGQFPYPDFYFKKTNTSQASIDIPDGVTTDLQSVTNMSITIPLRNTTTNAALSPTTFTVAIGTLSTTTPNVTITGATQAYPSIAPGTTQSNVAPFTLTMTGGFVQGTKIDLSLSVTTAQGNVTLPLQVGTGTNRVVTNLVTQNFDSTSVGSLPAGWTNVHTQGLNTVPWAVGNHLPKTNAVVSNGAFHQNANDNGAGDPTRDERLSVTLAVPASSQYVTVDFDIAYDTEDSPDQKVLAYDGSLLRTTDATAGFALIAEAYADQIVTATPGSGFIFHYPKHFPRSNSVRYLQDMSAWSGDSGGYKHVSMRLPGMASRTVLFRWDFVQDGGGICTDVRASDTNCGVLIDNIVINSVAYAAPTAAPASIGGRITTPDGAPLAGVTLRLSGARSAKVSSDANGNYRFNNVDTDNFYTVTPTLLNYHFAPENQSFSLLANKTDAVFTATRAAVNGGNVIDTPDYFVRQHYLDFLGREPDESGFNFWSDQISSCGEDAGCRERRTINVSAAYFLSIEFQQTGGLVDGLYRASYGRAPRYAEFMPDTATVAQGVVVGSIDNWAQRLEANKQAFVNAWMQRADFHAAYDGLANSAFVDTLISRAGGFNGDRNALLGGLNGGSLTRAAVLRQVVENEGFTRAKRNETFVMMEYFGYLRRDPDQSGYQFWLNKLNQFNGNFEQAEMVKAFISSGEYRSRFAQ